ncbi:MAG: OsmC family protein [Burkholderiaceae bacterium]|nr:OsmC family protein [Burkholderiaceae bacterium]
MAADNRHPVRLTQQRDFQFEVRFGDGIAPLVADEPPPLGRGQGPSPEQLLAAAVGNCLSASLLFSLRKYKQQPEPITAEVAVETGRNAENRLRIKAMQVVLTLGQPAAALQHLDRALATFEDFCTVTQSVRGGIEVNVQVLDALGARLK